MDYDQARVGDRIVSRSDGFTGGWHGTIVELRRHPSHPDAAIVRWDDNGEYAVALDLIEKEPDA